MKHSELKILYWRIFPVTIILKNVNSLEMPIQISVYKSTHACYTRNL